MFDDLQLCIAFRWWQWWKAIEEPRDGVRHSIRGTMKASVEVGELPRHGGGERMG